MKWTNRMCFFLLIGRHCPIIRSINWKLVNRSHKKMTFRRFDGIFVISNLFSFIEHEKSSSNRSTFSSYTKRSNLLIPFDAKRWTNWGKKARQNEKEQKNKSNVSSRSLCAHTSAIKLSASIITNWHNNVRNVRNEFTELNQFVIASYAFTQSRKIHFIRWSFYARSTVLRQREKWWPHRLIPLNVKRNRARAQIWITISWDSDENKTCTTQSTSLLFGCWRRTSD